MTTARSGPAAEVARVWREVLHLDEVTEQTGFFEAGGTSLAAMRACARLSTALGATVPVGLLLGGSRFEEFAAAVEELVASGRRG